MTDDNDTEIAALRQQIETLLRLIPLVRHHNTCEYHLAKKPCDCSLLEVLALLPDGMIPAADVARWRQQIDRRDFEPRYSRPRVEPWMHRSR